ncbi:hypothetical protein ASZ85_03797 [Vibrio cholerae]|nr:hypothetical protein ASZ85_03797 [Vibrio cholerae]
MANRKPVPSQSESDEVSLPPTSSTHRAFGTENMASSF